MLKQSMILLYFSGVKPKENTVGPWWEEYKILLAVPTVSDPCGLWFVFFFFVTRGNSCLRKQGSMVWLNLPWRG